MKKQNEKYPSGDYDFWKDVKKGEDGEDDIINLFTLKGFKITKKNKNNEFDCILEKNGETKSYEFKTDLHCNPDYDTGNMVVEFKCRGKNSGIRTSKADWQVYYFKYLGGLTFIKTEDLRALIDNNNFPTRDKAGDKGSNTHIYLIPLWYFKEHFKLYRV